MLHQAGDLSTGHADFLFTVAERIVVLANGSTHAIMIQLKPDHLGRISLEAQGGSDGLIARITTESAALKQFLESNLPVLQQSLQELGLRVHHIDIVIQEGPGLQNHGGMWHDRTGQDASGQTGEPAPADEQALPTACEITLDPRTLAALHPYSTFHTVA
ncbi:MAG: flagellar hook-length control protein FliK [Acidobacteria bacterium]|nr:flagellar hook-length control protein FliK [Acidobacteriota bacterium]